MQYNVSQLVNMFLCVFYSANIFIHTLNGFFNTSDSAQSSFLLSLGIIIRFYGKSAS